MSKGVPQSTKPRVTRPTDGSGSSQPGLSVKAKRSSGLPKEKLLLSNLSLLGLQLVELSEKHHINLTKDLFKKPSWKTFEVVFTFFYEKWDPKKADEDLRDFSLLTGRKRETEFRKIIMKWYKLLQEKNPGNSLLPHVNNNVWIQAYGDDFIGIVMKLSTFLLMEQLKSEGRDILGSPQETKNKMALSLSRRVYYEAAVSYNEEQHKFEESALREKQEGESTSKLLHARIRELRRKRSLVKEELKEVLIASDVQEEIKERLCDLEDDGAIEDVKKMLSDLKRNYNSYLAKIQKYADLTNQCRKSVQSVVDFNSQPPIIDFSRISTLLGDVRKIEPPTGIVEIIHHAKEVLIDYCHQFEAVPEIPDMDTQRKLQQFQKLHGELSGMLTFLEEKIEEQTRDLGPRRNQILASGGLATRLTSLNKITFPKLSEVEPSVELKARVQIHSETPDEMLARYEMMAKRLREEKNKNVQPIPLQTRCWEKPTESFEKPLLPSTVPDLYFSVAKQREYQLQKAELNSVKTEPRQFKARPVPSSTYRRPGTNQSVIDKSAAIGRLTNGSRAVDQSLFEASVCLTAGSAGSSDRLSDSVFSPVHSVEDTEFYAEDIAEKIDFTVESENSLAVEKSSGFCESTQSFDMLRNKLERAKEAVTLSLNLDLERPSRSFSESVDEVDSPVKSVGGLGDLSLSQVEIDRELTRMFGNSVSSGTLEPSVLDSSVLQDSLLDLDSL